VKLVKFLGRTTFALDRSRIILAINLDLERLQWSVINDWGID